MYALNIWIIFGYCFEPLNCKKVRKIELAGFLGGGWMGWATLLGLQNLDLSSPTKDQTHASSVKVQSPKSLDHLCPTLDSTYQ